MQPRRSSRIDLDELKAHIVKKLGPDKAKRYFYYVNRFLSQRMTKTEFVKSCYRVLGRENLLLHNHFIRSVLKNVCQAKTPPPLVQPSCPLKSGARVTNTSPRREDGYEQSVSNFLNQNAPVWSNGVLPVSPRKARSGMRDRKLKDRPSLLGPNGKVDPVAHQPTPMEDNSGSKIDMENGTLEPCDYQRPIQHLQPVAEQLHENELADAVQRPTKRPRIYVEGPTEISIIENGEAVEQLNHLSFSRSPLIAPLGIPYCSASVGGAHKAMPVSSSSSSDYVSCCDCGRLSDTVTLRSRMEQIAIVQGLGGVSMECANMLNIVLDVYLKRLIRSCVDLVAARSTNEPREPPFSKQQIQGKVVDGMWPNNHLHVHSAVEAEEPEHEHIPPRSVSLHDFKVAMELNPQQLGEDWPLLLEKISMQSFEE
ncbi:hypothetical protein Lal_00044653 [Lupinus albus]|uniref:Putative transcriptional coactivator Hfi1/Transcriptional adapter 1 n=1 Tax=Lupinus albus TaxID=3870 RepID=A0A6A5LFR9_LUPAL|nr:putative transcriptional coactivator Hfi1/Transcriptional adapter 1 [Lupinus albus]KAF1858620.1 hypothetical protein Lal_00044653 [Lupinus albus]